MSKYKEYITRYMNILAKSNKTRFIGYNTLRGHRMYGTLAEIPKKSCIETPVAENLMTGIAMGLSLEGFYPVLCFERMDFVLVALDSILNHMDKLPVISGGQFNFTMLTRIIIGNRTPLDPGLQHRSNYISVLQKHCINACIRELKTVDDVKATYGSLHKVKSPVISVEYKSLY